MASITGTQVPSDVTVLQNDPLANSIYIDYSDDQIQRFNALSNGSIVLSSGYETGDDQEETFIKSLDSASGSELQARDPNSLTATLDSHKVEFDKFKRVVVSRSFGAYEWLVGIADRGPATYNDELLYRVIIRHYARRQVQSQFTGAVKSAIAAISNQADQMVTDASGGLTFKKLRKYFTQFEKDGSGVISCLIMNSNAEGQLIDQGIDLNLDTITTGVLRGGFSPTFGKQVYVMDHDDLSITDVDSGTANNQAGNRILMLTQGAVTVRPFPQTVRLFDRIITDAPDGSNSTTKALVNPTRRINVKWNEQYMVKGFSYKGAVNPAESVLGTAASWEKKFSDARRTAGFFVSLLADT